MKNRRIFITGSTGFIGRHLVEELLSRNYDVVCLARDAQKAYQLKKMGADIVRGNLENLNDWEKSLNNCDIVIHLAAIRGEKFISWNRYYEVNVLATERILRTAIFYNVSKFIYFSSVGVLGTSSKQLPADESSPYDPDCKYHRSKMLAEQAVLKLCQENKINTVIIRPTITYGSYDTGFLYNLLRYAKKGMLPMIGDGGNLIHLLYVKGLAQATIKAIEKTINCTTYIIADKDPIRYKELISIIKDELKRPIRIVRMPSLPCFVIAKMYDNLITPITQGGSLTLSLKIASTSWYYKIGRAIRELNYIPYETPHAITETIKWYIESNAI